MPDHLHLLIAIDGDAGLSKVIRDFKRVTARLSHVKWQRNFFDHRLRCDESFRLKADYIRANPVGAGLIKEGQVWPFALAEADMSAPRSAS